MKINLSTNIQFQKDSIVSKTILKNEGGNVTLFAFDKGQALSEHTAPFDALFFCVEGNFNVSIGEDKHSVVSNELIILPASIPHAVYAAAASKCMLTMIRVHS
ncbi:MAG: cupin domain-containing protein [Ignavibacteriales bacterium]|nr:cupin domain-containing protein [Ignavibacteriales bacterium]